MMSSQVVLIQLRLDPAFGLISIGRETPYDVVDGTAFPDD
jgi:hypothetical protein